MPFVDRRTTLSLTQRFGSPRAPGTRAAGSNETEGGAKRGKTWITSNVPPAASMAPATGPNGYWRRFEALDLWIRLLLEAGNEVRLRPAPDTWSALEYAAHSRDVTALHVFGVEQALTVDEPGFPAIAGEELVQSASASYAAQDPGVVGMELENRDSKACRSGSGIRAVLMVSRHHNRRLASDVRLLLEHALHDSHHHLVDVENGLVILRARSH